MINSDKIILDLCGGTGAWSEPYQKAGYDVRVITLPDYDVENFDVNNKYIGFGKLDSKPIFISLISIYGILAAPPCTHFSIARNDKTAKEPRDFVGALKLVGACEKIIRCCRIAGPHLKFWAMENPRGYLRHFIGKPPFTFNPCDFGDPYTKATDIWGNFNFPKKKPVEPLEKDAVKYTLKLVSIMPTIPDDYNIPKGIRPRTVRRSITPPGFAKAFFLANK